MGNLINQDAHNTTIVTGYQSSPALRGTLDIVQSCALTIFLCTYTSIYLNVKPHLGRPAYILYKVKWVLFTLFCPELVTGMAAEQWRSARQSKREFARLKIQLEDELVDDKEDGARSSLPRLSKLAWSATHGFLADMGGVHLRFPDLDPFPLNSYQLYQLVTRGHIRYPSVERKSIVDKDKADIFARVATLLQVLWFTVQCIARGMQDLGLTTLELLTLAFAWCAIHTLWFWRDKPLDIDEPIVLECEKPLVSILIESGQQHRPNAWYKRTPLDFLEPGARFSYVEPFFESFVYTFNLDPPKRTTPVSTFPNTATVLPYGLSPPDIAFATFFIPTYYGIHFAAWNFAFPTSCEGLLWQIAAIMQASTCTMFMLACWPGCYLGRFLLGAARPFTMQQASTIPRWTHRIWTVPVIILYVFSRAFIVVEGFVSLRSQPMEVFRTVSWWNFVPHL